MPTNQSAQLERTEPAPPSRSAGGGLPATGRFAGLRVVDGRSVVTVRLEGRGHAQVTLEATPDHRLARCLTAGFRRLAWVRIDVRTLGEATVRCQVAGLARRLHHCRLPLAAALALAEADVPTVVRMRPEGA